MKSTTRATTWTRLRAQGVHGRGVIIAVIDGHIDTSIPELQGADIVDKSTCDVPVDAENDVHATYIAQLFGRTRLRHRAEGHHL